MAPGRIMGIDYGTRRVGIAISDPSATIAQPLTVVKRRRGKRAPVAKVARLVREHDAEALVVGLPLTSEGEESDWTREAREFGDKLAERVGRPVHYVDERMTSARGERAVRSLGLKKKDREQKSRIDLAAAVLILQAYLDRDER